MQESSCGRHYCEVLDAELCYVAYDRYCSNVVGGLSTLHVGGLRPSVLYSSLARSLDSREDDGEERIGV